MSEDVFRCVSIFDDALDLDAMTAPVCGDYIRERDQSKLIVKPGEQPAVFILRRVPNDIWARYIETAASEPEQRRRAFQVGVTNVEHYPWQDGGPRGAPRVGTDELRSAGGTLVVWSEKELLAFSNSDIADIGSVVMARSFLRVGSAVSCPLLPMWLPVLAARTRPRAESTPTEPTGASNEAPPASTAASTPASDSAPATAATATV